MAFPTPAQYAEQIFPHVQRAFPNSTANQHRDFAAFYSTHGFSGFYEGTCLPLDESDIARLADLLQVAAKERPELVTAPPTPHEALSLIEAKSPLQNEVRMTRFRELQSMSPDQRLAACDVTALIAARADTPPVANTATGQQPSPSAADRWNAMSHTEKIDEASYVTGKERFRVLPSDVRRLDEAHQSDGLTKQRDAQQISALKARDAATLTAADRMTLFRAENPPRNRNTLPSKAG